MCGALLGILAITSLQKEVQAKDQLSFQGIALKVLESRVARIVLKGSKSLESSKRTCFIMFHKLKVNALKCKFKESYCYLLPFN